MITVELNRSRPKLEFIKSLPRSTPGRTGCFSASGLHAHVDEAAAPSNTHHALVTLDHEAFVLVEATDTADDVIVLFMPILLFRD